MNEFQKFLGSGGMVILAIFAARAIPGFIKYVILGEPYPAPVPRYKQQPSEVQKYYGPRNDNYGSKGTDYEKYQKNIPRLIEKSDIIRNQKF